MSGKNKPTDSVSKEFAIFFICVLFIAAGLFFFLEEAGLPFVTNWAGEAIHNVVVSLLPSAAAIVAIAVGGHIYNNIPDPSDGLDGNIKDINNLDMFTVGDSCYYMGFLLTLWGLFLELLKLGSGIQESGGANLENNLIGELIAGNGLALLSTIAGLVTRFAIQRFFAVAGSKPNANDKILAVMRDHAATFASFRANWVNMWFSKSPGSGRIFNYHYTSPPPPPPPPPIAVTTNYLAATVNSEHGRFHLDRSPSHAELVALVAKLQLEVEELRVKVKP